jgi:hypothetical protein
MNYEFAVGILVAWVGTYIAGFWVSHLAAKEADRKAKADTDLVIREAIRQQVDRTFSRVTSQREREERILYVCGKLKTLRDDMFRLQVFYLVDLIDQEIDRLKQEYESEVAKRSQSDPNDDKTRAA